MRRIVDRVERASPFRLFGGRLAALGCGLILVCFGPSSAAATDPAAGVIQSVVGSGFGDGEAAPQAIINPRGIAVRVTADGARLVYIADGQNNLVRKITLGTANGVSTIAGTGSAGFSGDGGPATAAQLSFPTDVVAGADGSVTFADTGNNRIRHIAPSGLISTIAGNGQLSTSGDGAAATAASLAAPRGLAVHPAGSLYVVEFNGNVVRKVSTAGVISRVAGTGAWGFSGDGGPATSATLASPSGLAIDSSGNLYIADYNNQRIRRVDTSGVISTIAGDGYAGIGGSGGPAFSARLNLPYRIAFDPSGNLLIADSGNNIVRRIQATSGVVTANGIISTIAGNGQTGSSGDGGPATQATLWRLNAVASDSSSNVYLGVTTSSVPSADNRVRLVNSSGIISTAIGGSNGDGGQALNAIVEPNGVEASRAASSHDLYLGDSAGHRVRKVDRTSGLISTIAGNGTGGFSGDGGPATAASLNNPLDVTNAADGTVWIADTLNNRIRKVSTSGTITTYAGNGVYGFGGDNGAAVNAQLAFPYGVEVDATGNVYVADFANSRVRKITPGGIISTVAGSGSWGNTGDNGPATAASLSSPTDVAITADGTLFIADYSNHSVRRVRNGTIDRYAGIGWPGYSGDGGPAAAAALNYPFRLAVDTVGNLFIADADNRRIRRVDATTGVITTVAGMGATGNSGDGGAATSASLVRPTGIAVDDSGNLFVSQADSYRIREVGASGVPAGLTVSGSVVHFASRGGIPQTLLSLANAAGQPPALQASSDQSGTFTLPGVPNGSWVLTPSKTGGVATSVSAIDAAYALEATVGARSLSPEALLGCDVNASGTLSAIDAAYILQYRVGLIARLPAAASCGSDWLFDPLPPTAAAVTATAAALSGGACQPGKLTFANLTNSLSGQNFEAIPIGDCNLSWQSTSSATAGVRDAAGSVRIGRPRIHGSHAWFPVFVDGAETFRAVEATVSFDTSWLSEPTFHLMHRVENTLLAVNRHESGTVRLAAAGAQPIHSGRIGWLGFRIAKPHPAGPTPKLLRSRLDVD